MKLGVTQQEIDDIAGTAVYMGRQAVHDVHHTCADRTEAIPCRKAGVLSGGRRELS
ncbi:hypothetical protein [Paraburkholderia lycopersici]|uniref:hypothetical protein n=1 Tax=Paraburkholderia lycopersici TaxID=416944 RepID=UPI001FE19CB6|nr:hypothetical protein [Paraburkholderia lycopersici]